MRTINIILSVACVALVATLAAQLIGGAHVGL
jgi:hypothetical protein